MNPRTYNCKLWDNSVSQMWKCFSFWGTLSPDPILGLCPGTHSETSEFRPQTTTYAPSKNFSNPALIMIEVSNASECKCYIHNEGEPTIAHTHSHTCRRVYIDLKETHCARSEIRSYIQSRRNTHFDPSGELDEFGIYSASCYSHNFENIAFLELDICTAHSDCYVSCAL